MRLQLAPRPGQVCGDVTALVPFRCPWHGKTRLRRSLPPALTDALAFAMYSDVIQALRASLVTHVTTVLHGACGIPAAAAVASDWELQPADSRGLNDGLERASAGLRGGAVLCVPADLPALTARAVNGLLEEVNDVVVAFSPDGGTSALLLRDGAGVPLRFGEGSAARHASAAARAGHSVTLRRPEPAFRDVDSFEDLVEIVRVGGLGSATSEVLDRWYEGWCLEAPTRSDAARQKA